MGQAGLLFSTLLVLLFLLGAFFALFLLTVGDDVGEALVVQVAVGVDWGGGHHAVELLLGETVGLGGQDVAEVVLGDGALALWVEELEGGEDDVLGVSAVELVSQHVQENGEVDGGWGLRHHLVELGGVDGHNTQRGVGGLQVLLVDETVAVSIDHAESLLELLDLRLLEHGEDIGGVLCLLLSLTLGHFD